MPSARIGELLARAGHHAAAAPGRRPTWRLELGARWLMRPAQLGRLPHMVPRWRELSAIRRARIAAGIRPVRLFADAGAARWDFARARDKERAKVSLFDLEGATKTVIWERPEDLAREVEAQARFAAHGVPVLPFSRVDGAAGLAVQPLRGGVLAHADTLAPIADHLLAYARATAVPRPLEAYRAREVPAAVRAVLDDAARRGVTHVPATLVHGDLTAGNILRDGDDAWLIDFDRAQEAAATYDFVFAWVTRGDRERPLVDRALAALVPDAGLDRDARARLGLALFACDNLAYLAGCTGAARTHTEKLVRDATSRLAAAA